MKFIHNYLCTLNQCSSSIIIFVHWFNVAKWDFLKVSNTVYTWNWRRFSCIFSTLLSDLKEKPESNPLQLGNAYQLEFSERNEENEIALVESDHHVILQLKTSTPDILVSLAAFSRSSTYSRFYFEDFCHIIKVEAQQPQRSYTQCLKITE